MPKSPRKPPQNSPASKSLRKTAAKPAKGKAPKLQGQAAKLANLKKAPSHHPKRKRPTQTKPANSTPPPATAAPPHPLENWISIPLAHRRRHERMTHIDAWLQHVWRKDDGTMELKNANHFAAELRVTVDTIYDDIREMKDIHRLPIGYNTKRHGHYYTQEVAYSPFLQLSQAEMLALCLAELFIAGIPNIPVLPDLHSAVCKILSLFGSRLQFDPAKVAEKFSFVQTRGSAKVNPEHWHTVSKALLLQTGLALNYTKVHGEGAGAPEDRRGQPVQMVYDRGAFYVVNWDEKRQDYRNYHLGRINTAADTGETFDVPKDFDRPKLLRKNFSAAYGSGDPERVVLHFHPRVKPFIIDRDWHDTQQLEELPNGIIVLTLDVSPTPDFIAWIGEFHNDCRVIAPVTLREEILKKRQEAAREAGWPSLDASP